MALLLLLPVIVIVDLLVLIVKERVKEHVHLIAQITVMVIVKVPVQEDAMALVKRVALEHA